jgi:hypothetical protein
MHTPENKPTMSNADVAALAAMAIGFCSLVVIFVRLCGHNMVLLFSRGVEEDVAPQQESQEERRRKWKEYVSTELNVKEWPPDDPPVEPTKEGDQVSSSSGEAVEAPQPSAPPIDSSPASCVMGSDDCESLAGEEEMAGCAICLSHFKPQQLVCESNNSSCQHVFHKDCMVDWLTNHHDNCPMCREVYLLKTV